MVRSTSSNLPKYRHYRPKNLGVVRLDGRDFYLGPYGSPESHEEYDRLIAEWLANGRQLLPVSEVGATGGDQPRLSVNELLLAYWRHAEQYYRHDGKPTKELACI